MDPVEAVHGTMVRFALARLGVGVDEAEVRHDPYVLPDVLNLWEHHALETLDHLLQIDEPKQVVIVDNLMSPKPDWRPAWHVEWPTLVKLMGRRGYVVERTITVDYWGRRPFRRSPKWAHGLLVLPAVVAEILAVTTVPWQKARHTAWVFRAK